MKKTFLSFLFVCAIFVAFANEFAVPASANGAFADILSGTKLLRESGVTLNESSANIVELRLGLIKTVAGTRVSFLTLPGDTFFFNETGIRLERKGRVLATYAIESKKGSLVANPTALVFKQTTTHSIVSQKKNTSVSAKNTTTQTPATVYTHQQANSIQPIVLVEPAKIASFDEAPETHTSVMDSLSKMPRPEENQGLTFGEFILIMNELHPDSQLSKKEDLDAVWKVMENGPPEYVLPQKIDTGVQKIP